MNSNRFNIAIVGAARRHQGTGPFIARRLHDLGHRICGFIGSGNDSIIQTREYLLQWASIDCEGYCSMQDLCRKQAVDIVVICSPTRTHHDYIGQAIKHNCHVLVEKPWCWTDKQTVLPESAREARKP